MYSRILIFVFSIFLYLVSGTLFQEQTDKKKEDKKEVKSITVRFSIVLDSDSQITVDDQSCSLVEAETLYKFAPAALQTAEMKVTDGKAVLLKVNTKK